MNNNIILVNPWALQMSGYVMEEVVGKSVFTFIAPEDVERAAKNMKDMMKGWMGSRKIRLRS